MSSVTHRIISKIPHIVISLIALAVAVPLLWVLLASLRTSSLLTGGLVDFSNLGFGSYRRVLSSSLPLNLLNSIIACAIGSTLAVTAGAVTAYGFSRLKVKGSNALFWSLLLLQFIPAATLVVPLYKLWGTLGLFNSLPGLGVAYAGISVAICVLLIRSFIDEVPRELDEAAMIDGCGRWATFWRVIFPLLGPALAAAGIFVFITTWQEFVIASSLLNDERLYTITVGLRSFKGQFTTDYGAIMAGSVITALPILLVFALFQKNFVQTVTGGMK